MSALEGVRILDLTRLLPGPFATMLLADLGADVLKVEDTGMGDYVRWAPPYYEGVEESARSAQFLALNRGKRSIRLNLKEPEGREVLLRLVEDADVVVEGFRPGVMDRLGVGYDTLRERNPRIVFCSVTGYGQTGSHTERSGHDMNYLGLIGMLDLTGAADGPPIQAAGQIADLGGGGLMAAYSILAALRQAERSGQGQAVDVSMADGALSWLTLVAGQYLADGREVLLRLVDHADVVVEGFRPGVMDRLGVGYETLRERNPRIVFCSVTGYGQTGSHTERSGHDMNYLGLIGMLDLTGAADGPPIQAAGQMADLGGGGLMAAYSILAALREAERSGRGQAVDVSMADGALSWLTLAAGQYLADGRVPGRGSESLTGGIVCYRPYACADGYVTLGALEPKFWAAWCAGVGREDLMEKAFEPPGSETHAEVERIFAGRSRAEWTEFAAQHDCCLEPVLDLGEALDSELVREREMVVEVDQPGAQEPVRLLGHPVKFSGTPADATRPGPELGEHTAEVLAALGYSDERVAELEAAGAVAGPPAGATGSFLG